MKRLALTTIGLFCMLECAGWVTSYKAFNAGKAAAAQSAVQIIHTTKPADTNVSVANTP